MAAATGLHTSLWEAFDYQKRKQFTRLADLRRARAYMLQYTLTETLSTSSHLCVFYIALSPFDSESATSSTTVT